MSELLSHPALAAIVSQLSTAWDAMVTISFGLLQFGVMFFLFAEILKRWPFGNPDRHNFRLAHEERPFFNKEFLTELAIPIIGTVFVLPLTVLRDYFIFNAVAKPYLPYQMFADTISTWPLWIQVIAALFLIDLTLYIRHRAVHTYFWPYHTVHHAAREISWLTFMRLHPVDQIVMSTIGMVILHTFGFGGEGFATAIVIYGHFNRFNHCNIQLDYPSPLRYILVSPNMHRWHHAADDPKALNTNFCIVFSFIDLMFGTFYVPQNRLPTRYGVLDEDGNDVSDPGFVGQMLYPFQHHLRWVKAKLGRTADSE